MKVIGRLELVGFPEFNIHGLVAKIDTGAYTSAIHCSHVQEVEDADGQLVLEAQLLDPSHEELYLSPVRFKIYTLQTVKSSNGVSQSRYKVITKISIGGHIFTTEFTLADRSNMRFPVLLGRKILTGRYVVDVAKTYALAWRPES